MNIIRFIVLLIIIFLLLIYIIFIKKNRKYTDEEIKFIHETLLNIFAKTHEIFTDNNITYWAESGTLLGSVRENKIIKQDDDIDICVIKSDYDKLFTDNIIKQFEQHNLKIIKPSFIKIPARISFIRNNNKNNIFIDIDPVSLNNDKTKYYLRNINRFIYSNSWFHVDEVFPLKKGKLNNLEINIPNKPIPYLERHYGKTWNIPKERYNHSLITRISI